MPSTLRTKSGWLTSTGLRKGLSEQASWIDDAGARHSVYLSLPGERIMLHTIVTLNGRTITDRTQFFTGLNQARKAFTKEARHAR